MGIIREDRVGYDRILLVKHTHTHTHASRHTGTQRNTKKHTYIHTSPRRRSASRISLTVRYSSHYTNRLSLAVRYSSQKPSQSHHRRPCLTFFGNSKLQNASLASGINNCRLQSRPRRPQMHFPSKRPFHLASQTENSKGGSSTLDWRRVGGPSDRKQRGEFLWGRSIMSVDEESVRPKAAAHTREPWNILGA